MFWRYMWVNAYSDHLFFGTIAVKTAVPIAEDTETNESESRRPQSTTMTDKSTKHGEKRE